MANPSQFAHLCGLFSSILVLGATSLQAYEQGTLWIFEMVDTLEQTSANNRITMERTIFEEADTAEVEAVVTSQERSDFEVQYSAFGTSRTSSFNTNVRVDTPASDIEPDATSSFNLESGSTSSFGQ